MSSMDADRRGGRRRTSPGESLLPFSGHHRGQRGRRVPPRPRLPWRLTPDPLAEPGDEVLLVEIEADLHRLLESGRLKDARARLAAVDPELRAHPKLSRWTRALQPPEVRVAAPGSTGSLEKNGAWLREHAAEHRGRWVALRDGVRLGSHPDHAALHRELDARGELEGAVFVRLADGE